MMYRCLWCDVLGGDGVMYWVVMVGYTGGNGVMYWVVMVGYTGGNGVMYWVVMLHTCVKFLPLIYSSTGIEMLAKQRQIIISMTRETILEAQKRQKYVVYDRSNANPNYFAEQKES